jgi:shikimate kinase
MPGRNIVYLIGFMGSGKTTAGKRLATSMGWDFMDLDRKIEESAGKTIPGIFSQDGEEAFRKKESEVLKSILPATGTIISTGGGTPCHGDNMEFMLNNGITVYLKMTPGQLAHRLMESSGDRPLIKNIPDEELPEYIEKILATREKWYMQAEIIIQGINLDINKLQLSIKSCC